MCPQSGADEEGGGKAGAAVEEEPATTVVDPYLGLSGVPGAEPSKKGDDDKTGDEASWDKDRQDRDQRTAEERKALETDNASLKGTVAELQRQLEGGTTAQADLAKTVQDLQKTVQQLGERPGPGEKPKEDLSAALDQIAQLDETSMPTEMAKALKNLAGAVGGIQDGVATQAQELKKIGGQIAKSDKRLTDTEAETVKKDDDRALRDVLSECDRQFGPQYRNDALMEVAKVLVDDGFSNEEPPPRAYERRVFRDAYAKVKADADKATKNKGGGDGSPRADPGTGGRSANIATTGSLDVIADDMVREGRFKGLQA